MWICTFNGGLNKYNYETNNFTCYQFDPSDKRSISHNRVWSVFEDSAGRFWICTSGGLNLMNKASGKFNRFTKDDGLASNAVLGILEDDKGSLWVSTGGGISKVTVLSSDVIFSTKLNFTNYSSDDNLTSTEFNAGAFCKTKNGDMFFGSVNGLLNFSPDKIKNNLHSPPVVITSFRVFEKEIILDTVITEKKIINLDYKENYISIEFSALDFHAPDKNEYAFKMEGISDDWRFIGNRSHASFSNLAPGTYNFRVKASNNDGVWNEEGRTLTIILNPPFWLTTWFRIIAGLILTLSFALIIRFISTQKLKKKLHEAELQQQLQVERERISRELHDNIGANLTSIVTGLEISKKYSEINDKVHLNENIKSLEDNTRNTIDELRQTIWSLNTNVDNLNELIHKIKEFVHHKMRYAEKPIIKLHYNENDNLKLTASESLNLFRIIQEAVNNAIKYSHSSEIKIIIQLNNNILSLIVRDNGVGFDCNSSDDKPGFGIINMKKRASSIKADLVISSELEKGTEIAVKIKLSV